MVRSKITGPIRRNAFFMEFLLKTEYLLIYHGIRGIARKGIGQGPG
jgi:hypothetical protein